MALTYSESGFSKKPITNGDTVITKYYYTENDKDVYVTSGDILTANEDGLNITGTVTATEGKIGNFNIEPREGG
jgi:hypothetical protein